MWLWWRRVADPAPDQAQNRDGGEQASGSGRANVEGPKAQSPVTLGAAESNNSPSSNATSSSSSPSSLSGAESSQLGQEVEAKPEYVSTRKEALQRCSHEVYAMLKCIDDKQWTWHWSCMDQHAALQKCYLGAQEQPFWFKGAAWTPLYDRFRGLYRLVTGTVGVEIERREPGTKDKR